MTIDFYYLPFSPPCRSVLMLARAIGVHFNLITVNVMKGEHMKPEFLQINPQHTIPTLDDNGFVLSESRPMMAYLVGKYAKNDSLYPKDPRKRGIVDHRLYFDIGTLFENIKNSYIPVILGKAHIIREESIEAIKKSCKILNAMLNGSEFVAGDNLTIADISIITSIHFLERIGFDISPYDNVTTWYERCKTVLEKYGFEEINEPAMEMFANMYRTNLQEST